MPASSSNIGSSQHPARAAAIDAEFAQRLAGLPGYTRSLLRIQVPVLVTLATTQLPVSRILELGPGSILHFSKAYDQPLTLSVGDCDVAVGETVKIGEKFGLRITSMVLPEEKFEPLRPKPAPSSAKPKTKPDPKKQPPDSARS